MLLSGDSWIAVASESQTIQGYVDEDGFVEGTSDAPILMSQREVMRFRLWLEKMACRFEDAGGLKWSAQLIQEDESHWFQGPEQEDGFLYFKDSENWTQAWIETAETVCLIEETLQNGQYLRRTRWTIEKMRSMRTSMRLDSNLPSLLSAIADRPLSGVSFGKNIDLRQWSLSAAELMVLLERPELEKVTGIDLRQLWEPEPVGLSWVIQSAWHAQSITSLRISGPCFTDLSKVTAGRQLKELVVSDFDCSAKDIELISHLSGLETLSISHTSPLDLSVLKDCTGIQSLSVNGHVSDWPIVVLQNLTKLKLPKQTWGFWTEDLQLHQLSHFQIADKVPSRDVLHLECVQVLDMHTPDDAIDSFSVDTLILRGGRVSAKLLRYICIGCPLLKSVYFIGADIESGAFEEIKHLTEVGFESCRIRPQKILETNWQQVVFRNADAPSETLLNSISSSVRRLDISNTSLNIADISRDPRFVGLQCLIAEGSTDPESLLQANALISLTHLSIRDSVHCPALWLREQACISLRSVDLGGMKIEHPHFMPRGLQQIEGLRVSPQDEISVIQNLRQHVNPVAVPRILHDRPLLGLSVCNDEFWSLDD